MQVSWYIPIRVADSKYCFKPSFIMDFNFSCCTDPLDATETGRLSCLHTSDIKKEKKIVQRCGHVGL